MNQKHVLVKINNDKCYPEFYIFQIKTTDKRRINFMRNKSCLRNIVEDSQENINNDIIQFSGENMESRQLFQQ